MKLLLTAPWCTPSRLLRNMIKSSWRCLIVKLRWSFLGLGFELTCPPPGTFPTGTWTGEDKKADMMARLYNVFTLDNIYLDLQNMVLNRGGFPPPSYIQNAPYDVHHKHPVIWRTCGILYRRFQKVYVGPRKGINMCTPLVKFLYLSSSLGLEFQGIPSTSSITP